MAIALLLKLFYDIVSVAFVYILRKEEGRYWISVCRIVLSFITIASGVISGFTFWFWTFWWYLCTIFLIFLILKYVMAERRRETYHKLKKGNRISGIPNLWLCYWMHPGYRIEQHVALFSKVFLSMITSSKCNVETTHKAQCLEKWDFR